MASPSSFSCIFFVNVGIVLSLFQLSSAILTQNGSIAAVFTFGDSILDTGNNNNLLTFFGRCNFPPYGRDFPGGIATGRFSDGKVFSDFIVSGLGIKELLPAYHDPNLKSSDLPTGVGFASGGSGLETITALEQGVLTMASQLQSFNEYIMKLKGVVGDERAKTIIENSLFLISAGNNDIAFTYSFFKRALLPFPAYADQLVGLTSAFIKQLYGVGARRFGVMSTVPIGCLPAKRTIGGGLTRECNTLNNNYAELFNSKLSSEIDSLKNNTPDAKLVFIDVYNHLLQFIQNPHQNGFKVVTNGCCGTGTLEIGLSCNELSMTCGNANDYVFWDAAHPTEKSYRIMVADLFQNHLLDGIF